MKSQPLILVVDDQQVFSFMEPMLNHLFDKPQLVHCSTTKDAMHFVDSDLYADFIFADWDMTGYQFMDSVRSDLENHNTPVVIMSEDTTNKQIVLNSVASEATFFLAKPFLEKGLAKKMNKVMNAIERRRKNRIHPAMTVTLPVVFEGSHHASLPLVDISIDGCLLRAPIDICQQVSIYQKAMVSIKIDEFDIKAAGEVYRIGQDRPVPEDRNTVLLMIRFSDSEPDQQIQELVDELGKRW